MLCHLRSFHHFLSVRLSDPPRLLCAFFAVSHQLRPVVQVVHNLSWIILVASSDKAACVFSINISFAAHEHPSFAFAQRSVDSSEVRGSFSSRCVEFIISLRSFTYLIDSSTKVGGPNSLSLSLYAASSLWFFAADLEQCSLCVGSVESSTNIIAQDRPQHQVVQRSSLCFVTTFMWYACSFIFLLYTRVNILFIL